MSPGFYDVGPVGEIAVNLFNGWGYNFYRAENQLRADDQLVRSRVGWLLGLVHDSIAAAEAQYRRENMPVPTRAKPFPDPAVIANAQTLERLARSVTALIARVQSQPVPANDRVSQRYRSEVATLGELLECDKQLVGKVEQLRAALDGLSPAMLLEQAPRVEIGVKSIEAVLESRASWLLAVTT